MNLKGNLTSKGLQGSIGKSRMQGILGTNPAAIPITVDNALSSSSTNPVQNKVITAAITNRLWSDEVKAALLQIVEKVAYIDDQGQDYYDALYDALYPPVGLDSIGAVFDSSATIYNTDTLDDLKQYLTVTAYYSSGDSEEVTTYTLSGSMDAGTQTITVSYGGKTTTFSVTVVEWLVSIDAVFTQSGTIYDTDSLDTLDQYLVVTANYADSSTAVVSDYTLSGTLAVGTSTITVSYGGKTDSFSVTVTHNTVMYSLQNETFTTSSSQVNTGIKLLATDRDFSILYDLTSGSMPSNQYPRFIECYSTSSYSGLYWGNTNTTYFGIRWFDSSTNSFPFGRTTSNTRIRVVITHLHESGSTLVYFKKGTDAMQTATLSSQYYYEEGYATTLRIGTGSGEKQKFVGTLNKFELHDTVVSQDTINAFMG